jgi:hypothetical protein
MSARESVAMYHRRSLMGDVMRQVRSLSGRYYHWLSRCPRLLRRMLTIDGERLAEADVAASYFTFLAGQLPDGAERRRVVSLIRSGDWYEWLADSVGFGGDGDEIKVEAQRQLLFGIDWRVASRPLWRPFAAAFPALAALINRIRRDVGGASGLAHYLSRLEGAVMGRATRELAASGVRCLPLHDGILCGESSVDHAAAVIRQIFTEVLGFEPLVRKK